MNKSMQFKVGLFILLSTMLVVFSLLYLGYERGWFEQKQSYTLLAPNAENITVGMPVNFRGIPIGQVTSLSLTPQGMARVMISIDAQQNTWLHSNSQFSLDKPLVGAAKIKVESFDLHSPPLSTTATHALNVGAGGIDIPALVNKVNGILDQVGLVSNNIAYLTRRDGDISHTLANTQQITQAMTGKYGVSQGLLGGEQHAQVLMDSLQNTRKLTHNLDQLTHKLDQVAFNKGGLADKADAAVAQISPILTDLRTSLKKVDELLINTNGLTKNLKQGTDDMGQLRAEVDEALNKSNQIMNKINRFLPAGKADEVKLP
ncbi:MAG: MCE family protein [Sulfuriferula sp.]|nr:MCE family protein [Sulfuriferula sp.]